MKVEEEDKIVGELMQKSARQCLFLISNTN